jgi:hypothetical protein
VLFAQADRLLIFYTSCGSWDDRCVPYPIAQLFSFGMGVSQTLLPGPAYKHNPPDLNPSHSCGDRGMP